MAVGNTGAHLDVNADQLCTWLSRDGGLSWEDVRDNAHIYEFGDHGGILVTAKHGTQVHLHRCVAQTRQYQAMCPKLCADLDCTVSRCAALSTWVSSTCPVLLA